MSPGNSTKVRVWDLPTRIFHWTLAIAVVAMVVTSKLSGAALDWHARIGYAIGALLAFRLLWGFVGGHWSRFATFRPSLRAAWLHARGRTASGAGHNPLGAFSVYALLLFLALQVGSGLFSATKEDFAGPLSVLVSNATVHWLTGYHKNIGQWVLVALVVLHLLAVATNAWRGRNLVAPMITGDAQTAEGTVPSRDDASSRLCALALLALCALLMGGVVQLGG